MDTLLSFLFTILSAFTAPAEISLATTTAQVIRVIDGDTIEVAIADKIERVRYIGIDTPEPYAGSAPECYAAEATERNRQLVENKDVVLVSDTENRDTYNRLLRYVYVDAQMINRLLVREGYATVLPIEPNTHFATEFATLQARAQSEQRGLWDVCR